MLNSSIIERIQVLKLADVVTFPTPYSAQAYNCFCNNALAMPNLLDYDVDVNLPLSELYSELYYKYMDLYYEQFEGNSEATDYFFNMTD